MLKDKVILGENAIYSTDSNVTGLNNNIMVVAGSGAGKTMSVMEPRLLNTFNSSIIVTVSKRRIVEKYKSLFKERGYEVMDLNFAKPQDSNVSYDPLAYVSSFSDIRFLAQAIIMSNPRKANSYSDPYWDDTACSLLCAEIAFILMTEKKATFEDVLKLNDRLTIKECGYHIETSLDEGFDRLSQIEPDCFAVTCWSTFRTLPIKTASCVYGTLRTSLDSVFIPELRKMIAEKKNVEFEELATKKSILFVSTSAVNPALNCYVNLFYSQMFKELFEYAESLPDGKLPVPVSVLCDDFAVGSRILNFPEYISIFREKQISVTLLIQSESQLESMYGPTDSITIINNCDSYIFMGCTDLRTARNVSERLNIPLDEVLYMPIGQTFIFRRGQKPIIAQRYNIVKDKMYKKITRKYENQILELKRTEGGKQDEKTE